ncbi:MAG: hypothetical protein FJ109_12260 [Deltaproteobacteria bacterium]|nr:hypothetical protein [Deltaproteobacteria bacterium]
MRIRPCTKILVAAALAAAGWWSCSGNGDKQGDAAADAVPDKVGPDQRTAEVPADMGTEMPGDVAGEVVPAHAGPHLIPGPGEEGYDADLEKLARLYDRQFHALTAAGMAVNADLSVQPDWTEEREAIAKFLAEDDGFDIEAFTGKHPYDLVTTWHKVAGLYAGVGIAADCYRYGVLRDHGYPVDEVDIARQHMLAALDGLHIATAVTGGQGVLARGYIRTDIPSEGQNTVTLPLFDEQGNPQPEPKNNGAWRADNSVGGIYPNYIWEDSCSRDMYIGWCAAFGAAWEVIQDDPTVPQEVKDRLVQDALEIGTQLTVVRKTGYDLEIPDADGRTTLHGYMNENCLDSCQDPKNYIPGIKNGFFAVMALGSAATWAYITQDPALESFLYDALITERKLPEIAHENPGAVNSGIGTNFSNFNMVYQGAGLAFRYIDPQRAPKALQTLRKALQFKLYDNGGKFQPAEMGQSLFDFTYAGGMAGSSAFSDMTSAPDAGAMLRGLQTLREFRTPPFWEVAVENCDADEIAAKHCTCIDGTEIDLLGEVGWKGTLVASTVMPMKIRPLSNYFWRSCPYQVNGGGDGSRLLPGVDFRYAYWLGRWSK